MIGDGRVVVMRGKLVMGDIAVGRNLTVLVD